MRAALVAAAAALLRRGAAPGPPALPHPGPAALRAARAAEAAESGEEDLWEGLDVGGVAESNSKLAGMSESY